MSDDICLNPTLCYPFYFTYLENQLPCSWREYPSTLVPGLLKTAHPVLLLPPFHTPQIKLQYLHRLHHRPRPRPHLTHCFLSCVILGLLINSCPKYFLPLTNPILKNSVKNTIFPKWIIVNHVKNVICNLKSGHLFEKLHA
jgi:hypothetical protein